MCALFKRPGLRGATVHDGAIAFPLGPLHTTDLLAPPAVQGVEPLAVTVHPFEEAFAPPEVQAGELGSQPASVLPGPALAVAPAALPTHGLGGSPFLLATKTHGMPAPMATKVKADLAFMRKQPLMRRGVPARLLSDEQQAYWIKRLADAKRLAPRQIKLSAIFPDVPLEGDRPVSYRAEEEAIAYPLPEKPGVRPSTIVVGRHALTGEPLQGRFYRE